jgi:hypothetical protein
MHAVLHGFSCDACMHRSFSNVPLKCTLFKYYFIVYYDHDNVLEATHTYKINMVRYYILLLFSVSESDAAMRAKRKASNIDPKKWKEQDTDEVSLKARNSVYSLNECAWDTVV